MRDFGIGWKYGDLEKESDARDQDTAMWREINEIHNRPATAPLPPMTNEDWERMGRELIDEVFRLRTELGKLRGNRLWCLKHHGEPEE